MFSKILIANRGEVACRIIAAAKRLGIATVAVYSEAEPAALHVELADQAVNIGPAPAAMSYLNIAAIVEAARQTGAEAVHPGYGFLAENADFARALEAAGITFIGPSPDVIATLGDKIASKELARAAGVNCIPGHIGVISGPGEAVEIARQIGYPVMIKAAAGGGGKGMRIAGDDEAARAGFVSASHEARSSFGDDRIFIERYIARPRHIEIQVLGDTQGNLIHLGERECSIQRRHQKVIEEAPSPFLDDAGRAAMAAQALALATRAGYYSAGTVEFIVDGDGGFYFLEMNSRLQVEHPVTELVTGLDIVELMIRIAAGEPLGITQDQVTTNGWAVEARIYAEDPKRGFLPSIGRLVRYLTPPPVPGLRLDSGVVEGSDIPIHYDPMIAKICGAGATRDEAIDVLRAGLERCHIDGIAHNIQFLTALLGHPDFRAGRLSTDFIAEKYGDGFTGAPLDRATTDRLAAIAALLDLRWRRAPTVSDRVIEVDGTADQATVRVTDGGCEVDFDGRVLSVRGDWRPGEPIFVGAVDGRRMVVKVRRRTSGFRFEHGGADVRIDVRSRREARLNALMPVKTQADQGNLLRCPMPGRVVSIEVELGETVKAGQPLAIVEAMKMENILRAERDGVIARIDAAAGDNLVVDQVILELEDNQSAGP